jgi:hypothetical protein
MKQFLNFFFCMCVFVTKVSLHFEIYAQNGFLVPVPKMIHFDAKLPHLIIILMRLRLQVKILMRLLLLPYYILIVPSQLFFKQAKVNTRVRANFYPDFFLISFGK